MCFQAIPAFLAQLGGSTAATTAAGGGLAKAATGALLAGSIAAPLLSKPKAPQAPTPTLTASQDPGVRARLAQRARARDSFGRRSTLLTGAGGTSVQTGGQKTLLGG